MALITKMHAARETLDRILNAHERELRRGVAEKHHPICVVRGDAITFGCESVDWETLLGCPNFHRFFDGIVRRRKADEFLAYGRISRFRSTKTGSKFWVYYQRQARNLPEVRIEFFPDDERGLRRREIWPILASAAKRTIIRMEVAFDFGPDSGIDNDFVRRSVISGKCQPDSVREAIKGDSWGSRKGPKFIRSYFKKAIGAHRVEIQLNPRFLRRHGIDDIFQFHRLVKLIPKDHLYFAHIDYQKLVAHLDRRGYGTGEILRILKHVDTHEWHLCEALNYLRRRVGLTNVRRILVPLEIDQFAHEALKKWSRRWPKRLGTRGQV